MNIEIVKQGLEGCKFRYDQDERQMKVTTPLGANALLLEGFTGQDGLSQLFQFELNLLAERGRKINFEELLGENICVEMQLSKDKSRFFHGICSEIAEVDRDREFTTFRMIVVPKLWLLTRRAQSRIFQNKTVPQILAKVLEDIKPNDEQIQKSKWVKRPYCVQYQESDYNFICRLMEEEGIFFYFRHTEKGHEMVLAYHDKDVCFKPKTVPGKSKLTYRHLDDSYDEDDKEIKNRISNWNKSQELRSSKYTMRDHHFQLTGKNLEVSKSVQPGFDAGEVPHKLCYGIKDPAGGAAESKNGTLELNEYPGEYAKRFDAVDKSGACDESTLKPLFKENQRTGLIRMQQEAVSSMLIEGASNCRQMIAGHKFTVTESSKKDDPAPRFIDGAYLLTRVVHNAHDQHYRTGAQGSFEYENTFRCIPVGLPYRPQRTTPKPFIAGVQTAVVVGSGAEDEEIFFDGNYGRVKVQFHWDRPGSHNDSEEQGTFKHSSCWVRVGQSWAGKRWGGFFWPRIGQEVMVEFINGDPDRPIIVGSVYNDQQRLPYDDPRYSGIKTNSTPGGEGFNEIRFDDAKGKEQLFLHAERNMDVRVGASSMTSVGGSCHLRVGGGDGEYADKHGDLKQLVHRDQHVRIKAHATSRIEGEESHTVDGQSVLQYKESRWANVADDDIVEAKNIHSIAEDDCVLTGKRIILDASDSISIKGPGGFIVIDDNGISIESVPGKMVWINSKVVAAAQPVPDHEWSGESIDSWIKDPEDPAAADSAQTGYPSHE